jgi:putative ABC transport system substrate-binding protein
VVHTNNTTIVQELQRQKRSIPIVFAGIVDPVETGVVESLPRPGGNATGFMNHEHALGGKRLELLKEVAPGLNRVLLLMNSGSPANPIELPTIEAAAKSFGVQVSSAIVRDARCGIYWAIPLILATRDRAGFLCGCMHLGANIAGITVPITASSSRSPAPTSWR